MSMASQVIAERSTPEVLSRDSDAYKRIYALLEAHTFVHVLDEWKRWPRRSGIRVEELEQFTLKELLERMQKVGSSTSNAQFLYERRKSEVLLHVNDHRCVVTRDIANDIMNELA
jgi:hypothetical protein